MTNPSFELAAEFLRYLDPDVDRHVFQTFDEDRDRDLGGLTTTLANDAGNMNLTLREAWPALVDLYERGASIHVTVNRCEGRRITENIAAARSIVLDFDKTEPPDEWPLEPSVVVQSKRGPHVYWMVEPTGAVAAWRHTLRLLAIRYGADHFLAKDATTIRLPGFWHRKDPADPFQVRVVAAQAIEGVARRYELGQLMSEFGVTDEVNHAVTEERRNLARARAPLARPLNEYDNRFDRAMACLDTVGGAGEGNRGERLARNVVTIGYRFGIDRDEWRGVCQDWAARNLSPPLKPRDVDSSVNSMYRYMERKGITFGGALDEESRGSKERREAYEAQVRKREDAEWESVLSNEPEPERRGRSRRDGARARQPDEDARWEAILGSEEENRREAAAEVPIGGLGGPPMAPPPDWPPGGGWGGDGGGPEEPEGPGNIAGVVFKDLATFEYATPTVPDGHPLSLRGNCARFLERHGDQVRFCPQLEEWFLWTGKLWQRDERNGAATLAQQTTANLHRLLEHDRIRENKEDSDEKKASKRKLREVISSHIKSSENPRGIKNLLEYAGWQRGVQVRPQDLDSDDFLVNTHSAVIDIRTLERRPHDPALHQTKTAAVAYVKGAQCPRWEQFVSWAMEGDDELVAFLRRSAGYSLTGSTREQVFWVCYGTGGNGKSTFLNALLDIAGTYGRSCDFNLFLANDPRATGPTPELLALKDVRMAYASEPEEGQRLKESVIKQVTGEERINARPLWGRPIEFMPKFSLWLATNHRPTIRGTDNGIWRRVMLVPWDAKVTPEMKDPDLKEKLREEYPGILRWALMGAHEWYTKGLQIPDKVRDATQEYRDDQDVIGAYLAMRCLVDRDDPDKYRVQSTALYENYKEWCEQHGERPMKQKTFSQRLGDRGFPKGKSHGRMVFRGIGIKDENTGLAKER